MRVVLRFEWQMRSYKYFLLCTSLLRMYLIFICKPITHRQQMVKRGVTLQVWPYCTFPITSSGCISFPYRVPGCLGNMLICTFSKLNDSKGGERLIPLFREDCAYSLMPSKTARCIIWAGKRGRLPITLWEEGWCICITQSKWSPRLLSVLACLRGNDLPEVTSVINSKYNNLFPVPYSLFYVTSSCVQYTQKGNLPHMADLWGSTNNLCILVWANIGRVELQCTIKISSFNIPCLVLAQPWKSRSVSIECLRFDIN